MADCPTGSLVNRLYAAADAMNNDHGSSAMIEKTSTTTEALHYAAARAKFADEAPNFLGPLDEPHNLKKPGTEGPLDFVRSALTGDIAEMVYRPSEVLGNDITEPVLASYKRYMELVAGEDARLMTHREADAAEGKMDPDKLQEFREDSGLEDAIEDAHEAINEKFKDHEARRQYGHKWLEGRIEGKLKDKGDGAAQFQSSLQNNLTKNLLLNNIRSGILNHLQLVSTTMPQYGVKATSKGITAYRAAVRGNSPEVQAFGGNHMYDGGSRFDFFSRPERYNQGVTYFTAKLEALGKGASEAEAKLVGRKAIEQLQFKNELGNEPRYYWTAGGITKLSLLSYAIQMRRLHHSWVKGIADGIRHNDRELFVQNARAFGYFYLANAAINGVTSDIPEEVAFVIKNFFPKTYNAMRQADRFSLMGALDLDTAELARIPITGAGFAAKVPVLFDKMDQTWSKMEKLIMHPDKPMNWVRAIGSASLFLPAVPVLGNKNLAALAEWATRATFGDWTRYSASGKKFHSDPVTDIRAVAGGRPLSENLKHSKK